MLNPDPINKEENRLHQIKIQKYIDRYVGNKRKINLNLEGILAITLKVNEERVEGGVWWDGCWMEGNERRMNIIIISIHL